MTSQKHTENNPSSFTGVIFLLVTFCISMLWSIHSSASVKVFPVYVEIDPTSKVGTINLTNQGSKPKTFLSTALTWSLEQDGTFVTAPTRDLLVVPPKLTIRPGETRILRVGLRRALPRDSQLTYRVLLEQLRDQGAPKLSTGLELVVNFSVPVFVDGKTKTQAKPRFYWDPTSRQLIADNRAGKRALRFRSIGIVDAEKKSVWELPSGVLLAKLQRFWDVGKSGLRYLPPGAKVKISNLETNSVDFYPINARR